MRSETPRGLSNNVTGRSRRGAGECSAFIRFLGMHQKLRQLQREIAIAAEYGRLVWRAPGKFLRQVRRDYSLRFSGFAPGWQAANLACRMVDDIADGERKLVSGFASFPALIDQLRSQIIERTPMTGSLLPELLEEAVCAVERRDRRKGETRESFVGLLDAMLVEHHRRSPAQFCRNRPLSRFTRPVPCMPIISA